MRKTDLQNIARGFATYYHDTYIHPIPTEVSNPTQFITLPSLADLTATTPPGEAISHVSGSDPIWYKGTFNDKTYQEIKHIIPQFPKDPKTGEAYTYYIDKWKMFYYIEAKMERSTYRMEAGTDIATGSGTGMNYRTDPSNPNVQYLYITNYNPIFRDAGVGMAPPPQAPALPSTQPCPIPNGT